MLRPRLRSVSWSLCEEEEAAVAVLEESKWLLLSIEDEQ